MRDHERPLREIDVRDEEAYNAEEMNECATKVAIMQDEAALRKIVVTKVCPSYYAQEAIESHINDVRNAVTDALMCTDPYMPHNNNDEHQLAREVEKLRRQLRSTAEVSAVLKTAVSRHRC